MNASYERLLSILRKLPGLGYRSAERISIHLLTDKNTSVEALVEALNDARDTLNPCQDCGNLSEELLCDICSDTSRNTTSICLVENVLDLMAIERSGTWNGLYHILGGKLSPIHGVLPEHLNFSALARRIEQNGLDEIIFALSNDIEGNATCHYVQDLLSNSPNIKFTQVGFGLPSGGGVTFADSNTLKSAFETRRDYQ